MKSFSLNKSCTLLFFKNLQWHANSVWAILMIAGILKWIWQIFIFPIRINSSFICFKPLFFHATLFFKTTLFTLIKMSHFFMLQSDRMYSAVYLITYLSNFSLSGKYMQLFWVNSWSPLDSLRCLSLSSQSRNFIAMEL